MLFEVDEQSSVLRVQQGEGGAVDERRDRGEEARGK